jgi:hypothetical protein
MSIMPYYNNIHSVSLSDLEYLSESRFISESENKNKLFDELLYIDKNNIRECKYCNEEFSLISNLKKHLICTCFYKHNINNTSTNDANDANIVNNNSNNISNNISNNNSNNTTVNSNNTYNNCDINNINLYVDLKIPIPFEEDWDLSHISNSQLRSIVVTNYIYSELFKEILENDVNNNVIIHGKDKSGYVYMNHDDKYISMKSNKIAEKTMEKINKTLNDIKGDLKKTMNCRSFNVFRSIVDEKINNYTEKDNYELRYDVNNLICKIYNDKKDISTKLKENVKKNEINKKNNSKKQQKLINKYDSEDEDIEEIEKKEKKMF